MHDPRKPKPLKPRTLSVLVADANNFSRGLIGEILRSLNVSNIDASVAFYEKTFGVAATKRRPA